MKKDFPTSLNFEIDSVNEVNDFISECEIKVFYHGQNRNGSFISKPVGEQIAKTLPRAPIVAVYNKEIEDFEDHGEEIVINNNGVHFVKKTVPYGAVDTNAIPEWKTFVDPDGVEREYMTVKGYLWTGRYPELKAVLENPKGQSMELFEESVQGVWAKLDNQDTETFIFNEAVISALCILGDDVEPCFEGAQVAPISYSLNKNEFKNEFNKFMFELKNLLEGGDSMNIKDFSVSISEATTAVEEAEKSKLKEDVDKARKLVNELEDSEEKTALKERLDKIEIKEEEEESEETEDFDLDGDSSEDTSSEDETEDEDEGTETEEPEDNEDNSVEIDDEDDGAEKRKIEFNKIKEELAALREDYKDLKNDYEKLSKEIVEKENEEKEEILEKFSLLGEEVISEFSKSLDKYSVEELETELSALAFKKGINFQAIEGTENIVVPNPVKSNKPAWVKVLEKYNK